MAPEICMPLCRLITARFDGRRVNYGNDLDSVNDFVDVITKFSYPEAQRCFRLIDTARVALRNWESLERMNHNASMQFRVWKKVGDELHLVDPA